MKNVEEYFLENAQKQNACLVIALFTALYLYLSNS